MPLLSMPSPVAIFAVAIVVIVSIIEVNVKDSKHCYQTDHERNRLPYASKRADTFNLVPTDRDLDGYCDSNRHDEFSPRVEISKESNVNGLVSA